MRQGGVAPLILQTAQVFLGIFVVPYNREALQLQLRQLLHRMLACMDDDVLPCKNKYFIWSVSWVMFECWFLNDYEFY